MVHIIELYCMFVGIFLMPSINHLSIFESQSAHRVHRVQILIYEYTDFIMIFNRIES